MEKYTYLLVNFCSIVVCFGFSFHPRVRFNEHFIAFIKAAILVAVPFVLWDAYFTKISVWWFNYRYLSGWSFLGLPVEEWLFFICIPFACTYSYFLLNKFFKLNFNDKWFTPLAITTCIICAFFTKDKIYPFWTFSLAGITLIYLKYIAKVNWIGEASLAYTILLLPFFMVNGVLKGSGLEEAVVNYNPKDFLGIRILTVPVEDAVYGYSLIVWNIYFYKLFDGKN